VHVTSYPNRDRGTLSDLHRRILEEGSAISCEVLEESGAWTITHGRQLPRGFSKRQRERGGGILFVGHRPNGKTFYVFRPDESDPDNPGLKYEATCKKLGGPGNVLYAHPSQRQLIDDTKVPVIFVEGIKKALSIITSAKAAGEEVLAVAILGVWNWLSGGKPILDMFDIPVEGRQVYVCFDSDVFSNPDVSGAARRLAGHLIARGATVYLWYPPGQADGSKTGADDFLASGHSYREFMALMRLYDPRDLRTERLKRGQELRRKLDYLRRAFWAAGFEGMGGRSARDVIKVLIDYTSEEGKLHADGLRVKISRSELAKMAKVSTRTLQKAIELLEEMGLIYRDNENRRKRERGAFVLRAKVNHYREGPANPRRVTDVEAESTLSGLHLRAPRLMWSSPAFKGLRGTVAGTHKVRQGPPPVPRPAITRLGKTRGAVLDILDAAGGVSTVGEIYDALHPGKDPDKRRSRDLVRRKTTDKGRNGLLVMLEDSGILSIDGDVVTLTDDWLEELDEQRRLGKEIDSTDVGGHVAAGAETVARRRLEAKGRAFREWSNGTLQVSGHWTNNPDADGHVEDLERIGSVLSESDGRILEAIEAFEDKYGRGSFRWDRPSCKELFYSGPIEGFWPEPGELRRIRDYLLATRGVAA
jgi:hypothetical protein